MSYVTTTTGTCTCGKTLKDTGIRFQRVWNKAVAECLNCGQLWRVKGGYLVAVEPSYNPTKHVLKED